MEPLSAVDLTLSFGQRKILSDVSVDVQQGAVTALIGHSRAGRPANGN
jgi:ABC-type transporter Mla maintaining outer membrane lipid asymmetry ATPase subunit MlaF